MKKLLEAINRGILKGLSESSIELLADLDDGNLDLMDSLLAKSVNNKMIYTYFPKTKEELVKIIKAEVNKKGWNCNLNHINVSRITNMSYLFSSSIFKGYDLGEFNGDISNWDVSNVKTMEGMFYCSPFIGDISKWDVSNVENMINMFWGAKAFNQPIEYWDVSNVKDMTRMFCEASAFNQPIGDWNVSNVKNMHSMFCGAESFNQPIGNWDVSNVKDMTLMFFNAMSFNLLICNWDVSNVKDMCDMFYEAKSFNQDLSKWKIYYICDTFHMFYNCPIEKEYKPKGILA